MKGKIVKRVLTDQNGTPYVAYGATISDAVVDPTSGKTVTQEIHDINQNVGNIKRVVNDNATDAISFADGNGNVIFSLDSHGSNARAYNICDENGNVVATIDQSFVDSVIDKNDLEEAIRSYVENTLGIITNNDGAVYFADRRGNVSFKIDAEGNVDFGALGYHAREIIGSSKRLSGYELYTIGDSLSARNGGLWQVKFADKTGCIFDPDKNVNTRGTSLSIGGTRTYGKGFDNALWRTKALIDEGYITGDGENAIVIFENINDVSAVKDAFKHHYSGGVCDKDAAYREIMEGLSSKSIMPTTPIGTYEESLGLQNILSSVPSNKRVLNATIALSNRFKGYKMTIDNLPTREGNIRLWVGYGSTVNYYIHVKPMGSTTETMQSILELILENDYMNITDSAGEDGKSVVFSTGSNNLPTVEFYDLDNTGMSVTITETDNAPFSDAWYFLGDTLAEWEDVGKWLKGEETNLCQCYKSCIEMILCRYPKANVFLSNFPRRMAITQTYTNANGTIDTAAFNETQFEHTQWLEKVLEEIAYFYKLPMLNVDKYCVITASNINTFYGNKENVHPQLDAGWQRYADTVEHLIKQYI